MITTKKWEELTKMTQLLAIIYLYIKATSGISSFFHYVEEAVFNAFIIYKNYNPQPKYTFMEFKLEIIRSMLGDAGSHAEPSSEFDLLEGCQFTEVITSNGKKGKTTKEICSLLETKGSKKNHDINEAN